MKVLAAGSVGATALKPSQAQAKTGEARNHPPRKVLMKVGCQSGGTTKENLELKGRCGVYNIDGGSPKIIPGKGWDLDDSLAKRDACEKYGISLDAYHYPLTSAGIDRVEYPNMMLGKSPERDREIEYLQQMIMVAAKTGIKVLNYNTTILPVLRTGKTIDPKRGNAEYSTWNWEDALKRNDPKTIAGDVSIEQMFKRITYILDRLVPVAEEYKVKLANHIADPPVPAAYRGIMRWNSPDVFTGMKRFAALYKSPTTASTFASAPSPRDSKTRAPKSCLLSSTSATATRFSTSTCATSRAASIIFRKSIPTTAT